MIISFIKNSNWVNISKWMSLCIGAVFTGKNLAHYYQFEFDVIHLQ